MPQLVAMTQNDNQEIERKFLVTNDSWKVGAVGVLYRQGYLSLDKERTVRVRVAGRQGFITIKGEVSGVSRKEFEYEIPLADANAMLDTLCVKPIIEKTRHRIERHGMMWEVDVFHGENEGLVVAEIELTHEKQEFKKPSWIGMEVSDDPRYFNSNLASHPYSAWKADH